MIKCVVFDVDNTLIDSIGAVESSIVAGAEACNIALPDNFMALYGEADKFVCDEIKAGRLTRVTSGSTLWRGFLGRLGCEDRVDEFCCAYGRAAFDTLKAIDGAGETLEYLYSKYPLAIASNSSPEGQKRRLAKVGLLSYFTKFCFSGALGCEKPQRAFFDALIAEVGVNAEEIFYVGDSYRVDIEGAKACGMVTCWYDYFKKNEKPTRADYAVTDLREIIKLL